MKKNLHKICFIFSALLAAVFFIKLAVDYAVYSPALNSAPFYLWIIIDALYFLLPAGISLAVGLVIRRKNHQ